MEFPLFRNDGYSILSLNSDQRKAVATLVEKIGSGHYQFAKNPCQCGNETSESDVLITEKDMFGIPNRNILCSSCGMVRSEEVLKEEHLAEYYDRDYKPINYNLAHSSAESYYKSQMYRGKQFFDLAKKYAEIGEGTLVYDMGCGAGGVMHYFLENGATCRGNDFSEDFLKFGNKKGMNLTYGDMDDDSLFDDSLDFFILSHVYEHLLNPQDFLRRIFRKLKVGGILVMEVPGLFANIPASTGYPAASCQFAHVINFYHKNFLMAMYQHFGAKVLFGDERCTFLVQRTEETDFQGSFKYEDRDQRDFNKVKDHLLNSQKTYSTLSNPVWIKRKLSNLIKGKIS